MAEVQAFYDELFSAHVNYNQELLKSLFVDKDRPDEMLNLDRMKQDASYKFYEVNIKPIETERVTGVCSCGCELIKPGDFELWVKPEYNGYSGEYDAFVYFIRKIEGKWKIIWSHVQG